MARLVLVPCALIAVSTPASARPASTGWYAEGGAGATAFLLGASNDAAIGPGLTLRVGRDLASVFSVGIWLATSSHEATVPAPPEGEWFQLQAEGYPPAAAPASVEESETAETLGEPAQGAPRAAPASGS